jgi:hypothetical protein
LAAFPLPKANSSYLSVLNRNNIDTVSPHSALPDRIACMEIEIRPYQPEDANAWMRVGTRE